MRSLCHTLYGGVDWNKGVNMQTPPTQSHTLYGCVDWNPNMGLFSDNDRMSHPVWVCGLKLTDRLKYLLRLLVTPCMGVWIETI